MEPLTLREFKRLNRRVHDVAAEAERLGCKVVIRTDPLTITFDPSGRVLSSREGGRVGGADVRVAS